MGIPEGTLHTWIKKAKQCQETGNVLSNKTHPNINVSAVLEENKALKKRLARLEQEKAILKKAATYFATELG